MPSVGRERVDRAIERVLQGPAAGRVLESGLGWSALSAGNLARRRLEQGIRRQVPGHRRAAAANPARPTVGLAMYVKDAERLLPATFPSDLADLLDDVVVFDTGSRDATREVATRLGARLVQGAFRGSFGEVMTRAVHACRADWVLNLDADEVVSDALAAGLWDLVRTRHVIGWWLSRRWIVGTAGHPLFIRSRPHWPDYQARLVRRRPELEYQGLVHQQPRMDVPGAWGFAPRAPILHLDLAITRREEREAKVRTRAGQHGLPQVDRRYYLWEDFPSRLAPVPGAEPGLRRALRLLGPGRGGERA